MATPIAPERVLPTLNADGTRNRIRPRLYEGRFWRARRVVGFALMALFVGLPFLRVAGKPAIFLDVVQRQFTFFGRTFLATDGVVLMLLMLSIFVAVFWTTALVGRGWCGWACPQTVYMEFLFRPIERLFEGKREAQLRLDRQGGGLRRLLKNGVFLLLALALANVFLAYFVGVSALRRWVLEAPAQHAGGFAVVMVTTGLIFFDFAYFREQMCTVVCPYARLQSVLLDNRSLVIGYDGRRGEPRAKGKPQPGRGDCIDCAACVSACPTGIDIREGLQLECIACGQCVDACDSIMTKIQKPTGLIRYASQLGLQTGARTPLVRTRVLIYTGILLLLVTLLALVGGRQTQADVTLLRGLGAPFTENAGLVTNQIRIKIRNRGQSSEQYRLELGSSPALQLIAPENPLEVAAGEQRTTSVFVTAPASEFARGVRQLKFQIAGAHGFRGEFSYKLLGPETGGSQ